MHGYGMNMSRYLMARIAALSVLVLVLATALALWQAQGNIRHEEQGAWQVSRMLDHLGGLESGPASDVAGHLAALQEINRSGHLRHLQLEVRDAEGRVRVAPVREHASSWAERAYVHVLSLLRPLPAVAATRWTLQRADGRRYRATLRIDPGSEQRESFTGVVGLLAILLGYGAIMLLAIYLTVRRALRPLQGIVQAIARYEHDDYRPRLPRLRLRELDTIATALNRMAAALERARDIRRNLSTKMLTLQEDERSRLARELHDECGQVLTAMRADAAWLRKRTIDQPDLHTVAEDIDAHCQRIQLGVRSLLTRLRPQLLHAEGGAVPLARLLEELLTGWRERPGQSTRFSLRTDLDDDALPVPLAVALYRMTQEALTNTVRHAQAAHVDIRLYRRGHHIHWQVSDDGIGIEAPEHALQRGNGLAGICERVWALHGDIDIVPGRDGGGLHLSARLPLYPPSGNTTAGHPLEPVHALSQR